VTLNWLSPRRHRKNCQVLPTSDLRNVTSARSLAAAAPDNADPPECPLCSRSAWTLLHEKHQIGSDLRFVMCRSCGLVRTDPLPSREALCLYYNTRYRRDYKGVTEPRLKHVYRAGHLAISRFKELREFLPAGGDVLDVGSAGGEWLFILRAAGFAARGIEIDLGYAQHAIRELRVQVSVQSIWEADFPSSQFGAITMFHVLEHLPDPVESLGRCAGWLRDNGNLIVEVPNIASVHQHPSKRFHAAHLFGFTPESLELAARRAGLLRVRITVDEYERNILAVFRRDSREHQRTPASKFRAAHRIGGSVLQYYLRRQTYVRWLKRLRQFWTEYGAVRGGASASDVLQDIVAAAGILKANETDPCTHLPLQPN
jgi:SAM-dependent methyltransferase